MHDSEQAATRAAQATQATQATQPVGALRRRTLAVGGLAAGLLAACGGSGGSSDGASNVRMVNATTGYPSLDLAIGTVTVNQGLTIGSVGAYASVANTALSTVVTATGSAAALSSITRTFLKDAHYALVTYGAAGALKTALIPEDVAAAAATQASLQVMNLASDAGALDIYLTGSTDLLDSATANVASVAAGSTAAYSTLTAATYRLRVTGPGDKTDLRLDVPGLALASTQVATLILSQGAGGVMVNGLLLLQQGAATALANTRARVRLVSGVAGGAVVTASVGGVTVASGVGSPYLPPGYTQVGASAQAPVALAVGPLNGAQVAVAVPNQALAAGGDYTLLVWGSVAAPQVTLVTDDNRFPTVAGSAKLRLVNVTTGAPAAMTLKADFSAVASSVAQGQASAYGNVSASTSARLDVVSAGSSALIAPLTGIPLVAKGLYTMYMVGDSAAPVGQFTRER